MSFNCLNCERKVSLSALGTKHRNHCPFCLYSMHLDSEVGDRESSCQGKMEPIGLVFKKSKLNKYGLGKKGELMLVHQCLACGKISTNRVAGDDQAQSILDLFYSSQGKKNFLKKEDETELKLQLFGKKT
jgi:hypothetical protein